MSQLKKQDPERFAPITPEREALIEAEELKDRSQRTREVYKVLWLILLLNLLVAVTKVLLGRIIHSTALSADGMHSVSDSFSNVVGILALFFATRPADKEHPYGHGKIETLTGAGIGLVLCYLGFSVVVEAIQKFKQPVMPNYSIISMVLVSLTVLINLFVARYELKAGKRLNSAILISDSAHTRSDVFISLSVLGGLIVMKLGLPPLLDPLLSLFVAFFIFKAAWEVFSENANVLIDANLLDVETIEQAVRKFKEVRDVHRIRSRGTANHPFIDMHVLVAPELTVEKAHLLEHQMEAYFKRLLDRPVTLHVHFEPDIQELEKP